MTKAQTARVRLRAAAAATALFALATGAGASAPAGRYTLTAGTVQDSKTGLTWQQSASSATYTWGSSGTSGTAQNYCATLSLNGGGWRLPTLKELTTIVDYSVAPPGPMIDSTAFPSTPAGNFWSSTISVANSSQAWHVAFSTGATICDIEGNMYYVRCVR